MYDPSSTEEKWQRRWRERGANEPDLDGAVRPFYNLMMYPYPSAEGLHVGNLYAFTGADLYGRFRRLQGEDVFQPIGFDAFGIHSENHALEVDVHPMRLIPRNIENFERVLRRAGLMYDWSHTVDTTDPDYYRWTQWLFLQLFRAGLAERKEAPVNWCPSCQTVLANEQVIAGECERCGTAVGQKRLRQWFFRITDYVDRLLDNLEWIDWSETTKTAQRNWIGRSEGARIRFPLAGGASPAEEAAEEGTDATATAPAGAEAADEWEVDADIPAASASERDGEEGPPAIEVFTTRPDTLYGATFLVLAPEHPLVDRVTAEERREAVERYREEAAAVDLVRRKKVDRPKSGVDTGGEAVHPATGERIPIWVADYVLMEYGTGAIMAVPAHDQRDLEFATAFELDVRPVVVPAEVAAEADDPSSAEVGTGEEAFVEHTEDEVLVNSGRFSGRRAEEGGRAIVEWLRGRGLAEPRVHYRLHDWCISRQRYWGPPIPVVYCDECGTVPVPEEELPVELPWVEEFRPEEGVSPLARVEEFYETECPACGGPARRETDVSDTFLDSSWYFLRYPSTEFDDRPMDPDRTERWLPVDMYIGGEEHAVLHLLYSRFVTMVLHDLGHLDFEEPYDRFRKHGLLTKEGAKISKSRGNVIVPDEYLEEHGADVFRAYLMFAGPFQENSDFRDEGIVGIERFFSRVWESVAAAADGDRSGFGDEALERELHRTVKSVTEDMEGLAYNTAISSLMEYLNALRAEGRTPTPEEVRPLVVMLAPVAPHLAEETWERIGDGQPLFGAAGGRAVARDVWPRWDEAMLRTETVEIPVQVNGRLRATIRVERGASEEEVRDAALSEDNVARHVSEGEIRKVIHVPDRMLNLVVG